MGLCDRADDDEYNSDGDEVVMNDNDVMEMTEFDDKYNDSNDFDVANRNSRWYGNSVW